mgnify:CR=1 FL=1|jgi:hypothetical protein|tara:strand:- start:455 stop:673 length:219 start_codon:yes stop_codon:yes gene_type:complete
MTTQDNPEDNEWTIPNNTKKPLSTRHKNWDELYAEVGELLKKDKKELTQQDCELLLWWAKDTEDYDDEVLFL